MSLEHLLLGLLREPASGYDLKKVLDERIRYFWAAELSQIYPTLNRLEKRGWARSRRAPSKRGSGRRLYEITRAGRRTLRAWLSGAPQFGDERYAYLAQLYLMDELRDPRQTIRFLREVREHVVAKLEALRRLDRAWAEADPRYPDALPLQELHIQLTLRMGLLALEADVRWCDESLTRMRARARARSTGGSRRTRPLRSEKTP